ncbi:hypothetical protein E4U41_004898 [Claviceps citrina]|nr:hypothetical protein E4U41_004898 [Claviceps citrina]
MGNICGKEDPEPDHDHLANRIPGPGPGPASSSSHRRAPVPASRHKVGGPARTLGGGSSSSSSTSPAHPTSSTNDAADARRKAAEAAEARAKASSKPGGKLQSQLAAQKRQSRSDALRALAEEERRAREIARNEDSRLYD